MTGDCGHAEDIVQVASNIGGSGYAALEAIALPDPAPGFPLRRGKDATRSTSNGPNRSVIWSKDFLLGRTPPTVRGAASFPTGPEVTITVTRAATAAANINPVVGTTTARGRPATIVREQTGHGEDVGVIVTAGGFVVRADGFSSGFQALTADQLVTLLESVTGIPDRG